MTAQSEPSRRPAKQPGRLSQALIGLFMKRATVAAIEDVAERFRLVTLDGEALQNTDWIAGQKIQVAMGSAFAARTYTPIEWDRAAGCTRILGYAHGVGPGSEWLRDLRIGDECDLFGPRGSLDARDLAGLLVVFGDETSIGLGYALARQDRVRRVACVFEAGDTASARQVIAGLDLADAALFERQADDAHLAQVEAAIAALVDAGGSVVLTGRAAAVQHLRQTLKRRGVPASRIAAKAYWAPGKVGMD